jgi:hypothetical protein
MTLPVGRFYIFTRLIRIDRILRPIEAESGFSV